MPNIIEVTHEDIERLNFWKLNNLLMKLLHLEAIKFKIHQNSVRGSANIHLSDGGEDARIKWDGATSATDFIPRRFTLLQSKATDMDASGCKRELLKSNGTELKPRVEEVLDANGTYILFNNRESNTEHDIPKITAMREAIKIAGKDYAETADLRIYHASQIATWVNNYIAAIKQVSENIGRPIMPGFFTWQEWSRYAKMNEFSYIENDNLSEKIKVLRSELIEPKKVARIIGLSGLGKTRLALETFRPPRGSEDDITQQILSDQIVYCDAEKMNKITDLSTEISTFRTQNLSGIVIVDNCDYQLHKQLLDEIIHPDSQMSLLTLDFTINETRERHPYIVLEQASDKVIEGIIKQAYPEIKRLDIERIIKFAQGSPQLAVLLAKAGLRKEDNIASLNDNKLLERLLWGHGEVNNEHLEVISACSLFENLGFIDRFVVEREFVAEKFCDNVTSDNFYSIVKEFIEKRIIDQRNRFIRVVPPPLAIRLAADWWKKCSPEKAIHILTEEQFPERLLNVLCSRLSLLHFLPEAQQLTEELCRKTILFDQAEALQSKRGSRLFSALVEVNPEATADALYNAFINYSESELKEKLTGRRNLVESIEKLCFWKNTYTKSAIIMCKFAAAENEIYANNATNLFLQLYQIRLSGTQASYELRIKTIDQILNLQNMEYDKIAILALGRGLQSSHLSRMVGVEIQGSRALQDEWQPKTWGEIFNYWRECLKRLTKKAIQDNELGVMAKEQISNSIRSLVEYGLLDELENIIDNITDKNSKLWIEGLKKIQESISYVDPNIPKKALDRLKVLEEKMTPKSIENMLELFVTEPAWGQVKKNDDGTYINLSEEKAKKLAQECAKNYNEFSKQIDVVLHGPVANGYIFGDELGNKIDNSSMFIDDVLQVLRKLSRDKINTIVLSRFLNSIRDNEPKLVQETLKNIVEDDSLSDLYSEILRFSRPTINELMVLIDLIKNKELNIESLTQYKYGSVINHLNDDDAMKFCSAISEINTRGTIIATAILYMYCLNVEEKIIACLDQFRELIIKKDFLKELIDTDEINLHTYQELIKLILKNKDDEELAEAIILQITEICSSKDFFSYTLSHYLSDVIEILLTKHRIVAWKHLSNVLLSEDTIDNFNLMRILEYYKTIETKDSGPLSVLDDDFILEWCRSNPDIAPRFTIELFLNLKDLETITLTPIVNKLIDEFGDDSKMLSSVFVNLYPKSYWGSPIPYLNRNINILNKYLEHSNSNVAEWAKESINRLKIEIDYENKREEEFEIGIY